MRVGVSKHETREEHPLPAIIMHWIHLVSTAVLIVTGFLIATPLLGESLTLNRTFHLIFAWILIATGVVRIYWAFFGSGSAPLHERYKIPDYKFFFPQKENRGKVVQMIEYYLFLRRYHPITAKYNPLQKGAYVFLVVLILIQMLTGFAMWTPTAPTLLPVTYFLGGPVVVRNIHYFVMWGFIVITAIHIYLVLVESVKELPLMFLWREPANSSHKERT